ncbi:unnamed protein product [Caenorhabditis auriculariae]|uniref:Uncharacterized protein n=1 Tax=Caenorhabditis auriculariae TaxID=2777116 RepID=A0A8S1HBW1_9PELO|nr:unnamed protein product [Caenorhabditis auriculariae]
MKMSAHNFNENLAQPTYPVRPNVRGFSFNPGVNALQMLQFHYSSPTVSQKQDARSLRNIAAGVNESRDEQRQKNASNELFGAPAFQVSSPSQIPLPPPRTPFARRALLETPSRIPLPPARVVPKPEPRNVPFPVQERFGSECHKEYPRGSVLSSTLARTMKKKRKPMKRKPAKRNKINFDYEPTSSIGDPLKPVANTVTQIVLEQKNCLPTSVPKLQLRDSNIPSRKFSFRRAEKPQNSHMNIMSHEHFSQSFYGHQPFVQQPYYQCSLPMYGSGNVMASSSYECFSEMYDNAQRAGFINCENSRRPVPGMLAVTDVNIKFVSSELLKENLHEESGDIVPLYTLQF